MTLPPIPTVITTTSHYNKEVTKDYCDCHQREKFTSMDLCLRHVTPGVARGTYPSTRSSPRELPPVPGVAQGSYQVPNLIWYLSHVHGEQYQKKEKLIGSAPAPNLAQVFEPVVYIFLFLLGLVLGLETMSQGNRLLWNEVQLWGLSIASMVT